MNNDRLKQVYGITRRKFVKYLLGTATYISLGTLTFGCNDIEQTELPEYPVDSNVVTTLQNTVKLGTNFSGTIEPQDLKNISEYDRNGYGVWTDGGPLAAHKRKDIMSTTYIYPSEIEPETLLRFFAITDIHITDKESPSQMIYMQPLNENEFEASVTSVYSPNMLYTPHVLDAVVQTVNALHQTWPIDFGISLGDTCNSTQYNELRWYIDVLDGQEIYPSSGAHAGADTIDYQKPFKAAGLNPSIPWYQAIGNHDHFWLGSIPVEFGGLADSYTSGEVIAMPNILANGSSIYKPSTQQYYMGVIDGTTSNGKIINTGKVTDTSSPPRVVADPDRRSLSKTQWKEEFFNTSTNPVGHGFNLVPSGQEAGFACYSFVPKSNIPIKVIVLDDTQSEEDGVASIHGRGFLDQARWTWLKQELADGDAGDQLMIIAAHVPIGVQPPAVFHGDHDTYMDWYDNSKVPSGMQNAVDLPGLLEELHSHPNLLMWMAGHRHVNTVKAFVTDDALKPERGFWQVETSSLLNFPQQLRMFEINLNSDYTISIVATNVDPAVKEGTPAGTSRKYAVATQQIVNNSLKPNFKGADPTIPGYPDVLDPSITKTNYTMDMDVLSYNGELFKQLSPTMEAKMRALYPNV